MHPTPTGQSPAHIRVMVVDDSAVVRGLISRALGEDPQIEVVATAANGRLALTMLKRTEVDVILLDIEMPEMDGMEALPQLLEISPSTRVIMASTLTVRNAEISLKAMEMGASDYVPKPSARNDEKAASEFYSELIRKVKTLGFEARKNPVIAPAVKAEPVAAKPQQTTKPVAQKYEYPAHKVQALAIASSTGGPQALLTLVKQLKGQLRHVPIYITQHMPATFTTILAEHIGKESGKPTYEARDAQQAKAGEIYLAPGDHHMVLEGSAGQPVLRLNQNPPVNFCRPSADPMIDSLIAMYGKHLLLTVLTGMGHDGLDGARKLVEAGGTVIAQDEATSVVWGMPRAVAEQGLCKAVLPLPDISAYLLHACGEA